MRCKATTGYSDLPGTPTQCRRGATHGDFCWQHQKKDPGATKKTAKPSGKFYLINAMNYEIVDGPETDLKILLSVATEEVSHGVRQEHLLIVQEAYAIETEPAVLKLTEVR